ncbi:MAG TPA: DUF998 domain-containing protein, partial [Candidatus Limnocylindrales bacterium]
MQAANFIVSGLLIGAFGLGVRRVSGDGSRWLPRLIGLAGLGLVWAGLFPSDPQGGYPAWIPMEVANNLTWHARLHYIGGVTVVSALPLAIVAEARRATAAGHLGRARYAWVSAALAAGCTALGLALGGFGGTFAWAGLVQRASFIAALQWLVLFAVMQAPVAGRRHVGYHPAA